MDDQFYDQFQKQIESFRYIIYLLEKIDASLKQIANNTQKDPL